MISFGILIINHYFACGWYFIGTSGYRDNWIDASLAPGASELDKYTTALHWSLTQFTPAAMEVFPRNIVERLYAIVTLFFAMVTFSTFVSSITNGMTTLRKLKSDPAKQQKILTDYFTENKISAELGHRIWEYLKTKHYAYTKRYREKDIEAFRLLPASLPAHASATDRLHVH